MEDNCSLVGFCNDSTPCCHFPFNATYNSLDHIRLAALLERRRDAEVVLFLGNDKARGVTGLNTPNFREMEADEVCCLSSRHRRGTCACC